MDRGVYVARIGTTAERALDLMQVLAGYLDPVVEVVIAAVGVERRPGDGGAGQPGRAVVDDPAAVASRHELVGRQFHAG
jgi:hypothetical protein